MELLKIEHVKRVFNTRLGFNQCMALKDVNFGVAAGEFVSIMGPSGSGKSTLLNIIASLDRPTAGDVYLEGRGLKSIPERELAAFRRDNLGFVFQEFNLLDTFSVRDNILLPLVLSNMRVAEMEERLGPVVQSLGITSLLEKYPYEISGGEKQRTAVARAIITRPKIILADEPTGALDSRASTNLLELFESLNKRGNTILMVTHSAMAASYASRVLFIRDGEVFSQIYRGGDNNRAFYERIVANLSVLEENAPALAVAGGAGRA